MSDMATLLLLTCAATMSAVNVTKVSESSIVISFSAKLIHLRA
jgi:hypothetical protein